MRNAALLAALAVSGLAGCARHRSAPFADVTAPSQMRSTPAETAADAQAATRPAAAVAQNREAQPVQDRVVVTPTTRPVFAPVATNTAAPTMSPMEVPSGVVVGPDGLPIGGTIVPPAPRTTIAVHVDGQGNARREWDLATHYRESGDIPATPTLWAEVGVPRRRPDFVNSVWEPVEFGVNVVLVPVRAVLTPPWKTVIYSPAGKAAQEQVIYGQPSLAE